MTAWKTFYPHLIDTRFIEEVISETPTYTIIVKVAYFRDETLTEKVFEEEKTFENIPYIPEWNGALWTVYKLINE